MYIGLYMHECICMCVCARALITNFMEQSSSSGANSCSGNQEISRFSPNPKVQYCVDKSPSLVPS
jgi:hypothetical protein